VQADAHPPVTTPYPFLCDSCSLKVLLLTTHLWLPQGVDQLCVWTAVVAYERRFPARQRSARRHARVRV
jgi:hypothetical protein